MSELSLSAAVDRARRAGVLMTDALDQRPHRTPDFSAENGALHRLARALTTSSGAVLRELAHITRELCGAAYAGINLVQEDSGGRRQFRCSAFEGDIEGDTTVASFPADNSPDGMTLYLGCAQLFAQPEHHFDGLYAKLPDVVEALVVPIPGQPLPWGTLWVASRDERHGFDAEHRRVLTALADFTCAALTISRAESDARRHAMAAEAAKDALALAEAHKDSFIATLGHELRNPLAPIDAELKVLRKLCSDHSAALPGLDIVDRQVAHLCRLVDDLLDASRMKHGKLSIHPTCGLLQDIIADAVTAVKAEAERRQHRLTIDVPVYPVHVCADTARIVQVVSNLLSNAVKYTPAHGQIDVLVEAPDLSNRPTKGASLEDVVITVRDNGIGISPALLTYVFRMFSQSASARTRAEGGLGIGLSVVKHLVDAHHGRVDIFSEGEGKGTQVVIRLPIASHRASEGEEKDAASVSPAFPPLRILVVDDNVDATEALGTLLELEGHEVKQAQSGREALSIVETFAPEVALIDNFMPGMGGMELARRLRERTLCASTLLVEMTGYSQAEPDWTGTEGPFDCKLLKPVSLDDLATVLASSSCSKHPPRPCGRHNGEPA